MDKVTINPAAEAIDRPRSATRVQGRRIGNFSFNDQRRQLYSIAMVLSVWVITTWFFWVGYVGTDDFFYARYAFLLHRMPINWWEFRVPAVLAIRLSFLLLGPTPFAAAVPSLLASLLLLVSVAWFVDWPSNLNWKTQASMLIGATLPFDVSYRSVPGATHLAGGFLAMGTVLLLKGKRVGQLLGALFLTVGFLTHELSFFYIAFLCLSALFLDRKRYWRAVVACVTFAAAAVLLEGTTYLFLMGDFFARYRSAGALSARIIAGYDPDTGIGGVYFFLWPLQNFIFGNSFSFDLLLLLVCGITAWKQLAKEQAILFAATFLTLTWLGYGTQLPSGYHPMGRQMHLYFCMTLGVAALVPAVLGSVLAKRKGVAPVAIYSVLAVHIICLAGSGRWGQEVVVSQELLRYAASHSDRVFVTDVRTMNDMYTLGGFRLPSNVVCVNGPAVENHLRINKEPSNVPRYRFPNPRIDGILINSERLSKGGVDDEFTRYLGEHSRGKPTVVVPVRYKLLFSALGSYLGRHDFMLKSHGGTVVDAAS